MARRKPLVLRVNVRGLGVYRVELYPERLPAWEENSDESWRQTGDLVKTSRRARVWSKQRPADVLFDVIHELLHEPVERYAGQLAYEVKEKIVRDQTKILRYLRAQHRRLWP